MTDIKMPVMDGIQLIRKTKALFPDIIFAVLSGYGEYEFTSQAMEEGVRHYILKPCDEERIIQVLEQVKKEIGELRRRKEQEREYRSAMHRLLPRAKEQMFRNLLLDREPLEQDYQMFLRELRNRKPKVRVLAFRSAEGFDYLEQFILDNILRELIGEERVLLSTAVDDVILFLLEGLMVEPLGTIVEHTCREFVKFKVQELAVAVSREGELGELHDFYIQIQELLRIGEIEGMKGLLHYGLFDGSRSNAAALADISGIGRVKEYGELLFELQLLFLKMQTRNYTEAQMEEVCRWICTILCGEKLEIYQTEGTGGTGYSLKDRMTELIAEYRGIAEDGILRAVYDHMQNPELSIQFLAREILFMNEDYFGRQFYRNYQRKFTAYLLEKRVELARRLLEYDPELRITRAAELVGYSPDGQYFSKAFRKMTGMTPTEYRDQIKRSRSL